MRKHNDTKLFKERIDVVPDWLLESARRVTSDSGKVFYVGRTQKDVTIKWSRGSMVVPRGSNFLVQQKSLQGGEIEVVRTEKGEYRIHVFGRVHQQIPLVSMTTT